MEFYFGFFNSDPLVALAITTTFAYFFLKISRVSRPLLLKFRYLYRYKNLFEMELLERQIFDRFRLFFFYQNLRIALLNIWMMYNLYVIFLLPEERMFFEQQLLHIN